MLGASLEPWHGVHNVQTQIPTPSRNWCTLGAACTFPSVSIHSFGRKVRLGIFSFISFPFPHHTLNLRACELLTVWYKAKPLIIELKTKGKTWRNARTETEGSCRARMMVTDHTAFWRTSQPIAIAATHLLDAASVFSLFPSLLLHPFAFPVCFVLALDASAQGSFSSPLKSPCSCRPPCLIHSFELKAPSCCLQHGHTVQ